MAGRDEQQSTPDDPGTGPERPRRTASRAPGPTGWFGTLGQLDFDIDFFEKLLARNGDSVEVLRTLGELVAKKGDVRRALEIDQRLVALLPNDFLARYNLACSLARAGCSDEAIDTLSRAILLGYDDLAHMEADPDLESLRNHPDFQALLGGE